MKSLNYWLDEAKKITGSDYQTAKQLQMTRSAISNARKKGSISQDSAIALAKILDINPIEIVAACDVQRHPENRNYWAKYVAATVILSAVGMANYSEKTTAYEHKEIHPFIHYA